MRAGQTLNADLTSASVKALIGTYFPVFLVFLFGDFLAENGEARMLYARHSARFVASFQKVSRGDCEFDFGAVAAAAMSTVAGDHVELHSFFSSRLALVLL